MNKPVSKIPDHSLYSQKYQMSPIKLIKFEAISFFGRLFLSKKPPVVDETQHYLNLGAGGREFRGWVNADFYKIRFWRKKKDQWMLDMRYPLPCDDEHWDGIFSEHTIEHLYPNQVLSLFRDLFRTLKKGGWMRISVPDLKKYIDFYAGKTPHEKFHRWETGAEAIRSLTQNWEHLSVWDEQLLRTTLSRAGFINIQKAGFRQGSDPRLLMDREYRKWESLYMEAQKPYERSE